jgi:hypothetical protein
MEVEASDQPLSDTIRHTTHASNTANSGDACHGLWLIHIMNHFT